MTRGLQRVMAALLALLVLTCLLVQPVHPQDAVRLRAVRYPTLPDTGATPRAFVPPRWVIEHDVRGDLNRDGRADVLLVLKMRNRANVLRWSGMLGSDSLDTNPRILAILFAEDRGFRLAVQNHELIPRRDDPVMDDHLWGVSVRRGAFTVHQGFFASAGSYSVSHSMLIFRYQDSCFRLIGYEGVTADRGSHSVSRSSLNYATAKAYFVRSDSEEDPRRRRTESLPRRPLRCLDRVGDGLRFDPRVRSPLAARDTSALTQGPTVYHANARLLTTHRPS